MTLEAAAQLLAGVLMLLQAAADPTLPLSVRDGAEDIAQRAITEATRTIAAQERSGSPSCVITSDKYNYSRDELIVLQWETRNAASLAFALDTKSEKLDAPPTEMTMSGVWRVKPVSSGYPFVTLEVKDAAGRSTTCSSMVHVE